MFGADMERELFNAVVPRNKVTEADLLEYYRDSSHEITQRVTQSLSDDDISKIADTVIKKLSSTQKLESNEPDSTESTPDATKNETDSESENLGGNE